MFVGEGSRGPLRRLALALDDLPRPLPLPRAVREPLPARPEGEVQGIGARDRVVAGEPPGANGDLRARLLVPLARRRPAALPALPAVRARGLDLLLDVAPGGGAEPARQRRPDQE